VKPEMKARRASHSAMYSEAWLSSEGTTVVGRGPAVSIFFLVSL
jgi:hypothetical protein